MQVVPLRPNLDCVDIAKTLRAIAADIETGAYEFTPNIAVLVVGYEISTQDRDGVTGRYGWTSHGLGPKATVLASRGLLASAAHSFNGES